MDRARPLRRPASRDIASRLGTSPRPRQRRQPPVLLLVVWPFPRPRPGQRSQDLGPALWRRVVRGGQYPPLLPGRQPRRSRAPKRSRTDRRNPLMPLVLPLVAEEANRTKRRPGQEEEEAVETAVLVLLHLLRHPAATPRPHSWSGTSRPKRLSPKSVPCSRPTPPECTAPSATSVSSATGTWPSSTLTGRMPSRPSFGIGTATRVGSTSSCTIGSWRWRGRRTA